MAGLDEALNDWLESVTSLADLTPTQQAEITSVGAKEYEKILEEETRAKHYSNHDDKVYGHMADNLTFQDTNVDGEKTGVSTVGWNNVYHANNAMRLNDGTVKIHADHFITNVQDSSDTLDKVLNAEKEKYSELIKKAEDDS